MNSIKSHYVYHSLSKNMLIDFKFYLKIENSKSQAKVTGENVHVVHIRSSQIRPRSGSGGEMKKQVWELC